MKSFMHNIFLLLSLFISISFQFDALQGKLKDWSIIEKDEVVQSDFYHSRSKRGIGNRGFMKKVSLNLFGEKVHLSLYPYGLFSPNIKVQIYGKDGPKFLEIDQNSFMEGTISDKPKSTVVAHFNNGTVEANIIDEDESYFVEPLERHVENEGDGKLLVYRLSDVNFNNTESKFCGSTLHGKAFDEALHMHSKEILKLNKSRQFHKRNILQAVSKNICELKITVDHRLYQKIAKGNDNGMVNYIIHHMASVSKLFKQTVWDQLDGRPGGMYTGFKFQIAWIEIYKDPTDQPRFNQAREWKSREILHAYAENDHEYCLAHIFTHLRFESGVLGLAFLADPGQVPGYGGGICSFSKKISSLAYNVGMTTVNSFGRLLLSAEAVLVSTHEFGHNFGATHDEHVEGVSTECSPSVSDGGNYLMSPQAVSGKYPNNFLFSPCSKRNVLTVMESGTPLKCFVQRDEKFCGDYVIQPEREECDAGYRDIGINKADKCCTSDCKFTRNSNCSPINHACCNSSCQVADTSKICRNHVPGLCDKQTYCDGVAVDCPPKTFVEDGTECGNRGKCSNGTCLSYCAWQGEKQEKILYECFCNEEEKDRCVHCCEENGTVGACKPFLDPNDKVIQMYNYSKCIHGYCENNICVKTTQDLIERVYGVLDDLRTHGLIAVIKDNLVGGITIMTMLFWVPFGCFFSLVDRESRRYKLEEEEKFLDELDMKLPHYPVESQHGFDLNKIMSQNAMNMEHMPPIAEMRRGDGEDWRKMVSFEIEPEEC